MKRWFNIVTQIIGTGGQLFNSVGGVIPPKYQAIVATILGVAQGVIGVLAHNFNPDGTSATSAYRPQDNLPLMK